MIFFKIISGQLLVEPEKRFTLEQIARHPWTDKGRTDSIATARLIDDILSQEPLSTPPINDSIVDCLVRTVNSGLSSPVAGAGGLPQDVVDRESVMESIKLNKVILLNHILLKKIIASVCAAVICTEANISCHMF